MISYYLSDLLSNKDRCVDICVKGNPKNKDVFCNGGYIKEVKCNYVGVALPSEMYVKNGDKHIKVNSIEDAKIVMDSLKNAKIEKTED